MVVAAALKPGDRMILGDARMCWEVKGTSRAVPQSAKKICIFGPRVNGTSLRWFFDLNEMVEVLS
jgi:hypothetical protein